MWMLSFFSFRIAANFSFLLMASMGLYKYPRKSHHTRKIMSARINRKVIALAQILSQKSSSSQVNERKSCGNVYTHIGIPSKDRHTLTQWLIGLNFSVPVKRTKYTHTKKPSSQLPVEINWLSNLHKVFDVRFNELWFYHR